MHTILTTQRSPDNRKEMQTEVVWPYFPFIRSGQNKNTEKGGRKERSKGKGEKITSGMDRHCIALHTKALFTPTMIIIITFIQHPTQQAVLRHVT